MKKITTLCLSLLIAMAGMADEWTLVTSSSPLQKGDQIIIANTEAGVTAAQSLSTNNSKSSYWMASINSTFTGNQLIDPDDAVGVFTVEESGTSWKLGATAANGTTVYLGATAVKKLSYSATTDTWNISIDASGNATIASTNATFGTLYYNSASNSLRFCNYTSTTNMKLVQLYRSSSAPRVTISYQGFPYRKTACEEPTYKEGTTYTLPTYVPKNEQGKELKAWSFGGETYAPGASFTVPATDVEFVPVWDGDATDIDHVAEAVKAVKILRDGQLIIVRDGAEYNIIGTRVK